MSELEKESQSGETAISDEAIRRCLLGDAQLDERTRFEQLIIIGEAMENRVRLAELELADDYSGGRLSGRELQLFERNFLVTKGRGKKVAVSQALRKALRKRSAELAGKYSVNDGLRYAIAKTLRIDPQLARPALLLVALIVSVALVMILIRKPHVQPSVVAKKQEVSLPAQQNDHPENAHPVGSQTAEPTEPKVIPQPSLIANVTLQSDALDLPIQVPASPLESDIVRVNLLLGPDAPPSCRAELLTSEGQHITEAGELRVLTEGKQKKVVWDFGARLLKVGDYQIRLTRPDASQFPQLGHYTFRVH